MKAIVFAAGIGSRLKPFTDSHPKALAPVAGHPALWHVVSALKRAGVTEMVVNVHHFANQVIDYINSQDCFGITMHISDETGRLLETGGGIVKAAGWLDGDEPFIAHNADIITDIDLAAMYRQHIDSHADVTLLATPRQTSRYLYFDRDTNRLAGWTNEKTGQSRPDGFQPDPATQNKLAFGGVHVISAPALHNMQRYAPQGQPFSVTPFYVDNAATLNIQAFTPQPGHLWCDIGTPETLERADSLIKQRNNH